jgi:S-DNA-T family DNA segregation ATPase FtsK/SpoIIIE
MAELSKRGAQRSKGSHEYRISVSCRGQERDLRLRAPTGCTVDELASALSEEFGGPAEPQLWCERLGEQLGRDKELRHAGLRWGDRLLLGIATGEATRVGSHPQIEVVASGGPCAGVRFELGVGTHSLGRDSITDIVIADPSISRHHVDLRVGPAGVAVVDVGSSNGTAINGTAIAPRVDMPVGERDELEVGRTNLRIKSLSSSAGVNGPTRDGRIDFNRPPRVKRQLRPFQREIKAPPEHPRKVRLPLMASLLPLLMGAGMFFLTKSPYMLMFVALSPAMAISTYVSNRREGRKTFGQASSTFESELADAIAGLDQGLSEEAIARREASPDAPTLADHAQEVDASLWQRRPGDDDFLRLRLGVADLPAHSTVSIAKGGNEETRKKALATLEAKASVPSVPLTVDMKRMPVVGLAGDEEATAAAARWMVLQAALLHSPGDLVLMAALSPERSEEWEWVKWLPHMRPDRLGIESEPVVVGRGESEALLSQLRELVAERQGDSRGANQAGPASPQLLLLIDEDTRIDRALVAAALEDLAGLGIAVLWIGSDARSLPGQTGAIVEIQSDRAALDLTDVANGTTIRDASVDQISLAFAERTARFLSPIRDVSELARAGDIPKRVGLLELLGMLPPTAESVEDAWKTWNGDLKATVGMGVDGPLEVDIRAEGPHALIAGTTGSGKSELLRTIVAAAAAAIPPNRLTFLLVDYKGGAAFAPCAALPHVVDVVSDLDEHAAERALVSLNAELRRREQILSDEGARDLLELAHRNADAAPPVLIIAVDEFAKLREEVPDFVDGVVDIAQRGRSLGVHMILAAQSLRNAFTPAIRANTNLRIALRVSEASESEDMISSPAAARIPSGENSRGRAFARTGHSELREFQAAYVSGLTDPASEAELELDEFSLIDRPDLAEVGRHSIDSDAESDLVALGEAAAEAQRRMRLPVPPPPWLPPLPEVLSLADIGTKDVPTGCAAIGLVDLPQLQRQDPLVLDLEGAGNVAIFGGGNSGKTTALTTTALALAAAATPSELAVYCIDAAGGGLRALADLPHCAATIMADDEERVVRLLRTLTRFIEAHEATAEHAGDGVGWTGRTVLLIDDFESFAQLYDQPGKESPFELLQRILSSGRQAGVHVVVTASRRGALSAALASQFGQRLVLRMPTEDDLLALGLDTRSVRGAKLAPGSGFTQDSREFHVAVPCEAGVPISPRDAAASFGYPKTTAPAIGSLPSSVSAGDLPRAASIRAVPLGVSGATLAPAAVDLSELHFVAIGPYRSGRSTALGAVADAVSTLDDTPQMFLCTPRRSPLRDRTIWTSAAEGQAACAEAVAQLLERLEAGKFDERTALLFIDDGGELNDITVSGQLEHLVRRARDSQLRVVASVETSAARGISVPWIRELRREGHGVLLQPDPIGDGDLLNVVLPRRLPVAMMPGRGFIARRGAAELVHVATPDPERSGVAPRSS